MPDNKSPFGLPECNDPYEASHNWDTHKYRRCPVHSVISSDTDIDRHWREWARYREAFATAENDNEREVYLNQMLDTVTDTNPPDAPKVPDQHLLKTGAHWNVTLPQGTVAALAIIVIFLLCAIAII